MYQYLATCRYRIGAPMRYNIGATGNPASGRANVYGDVCNDLDLPETFNTLRETKRFYEKPKIGQIWRTNALSYDQVSEPHGRRTT